MEQEGPGGAIKVIGLAIAPDRFRMMYFCARVLTLRLCSLCQVVEAIGNIVCVIPCTVRLHAPAIPARARARLDARSSPAASAESHRHSHLPSSALPEDQERLHHCASPSRAEVLHCRRENHSRRGGKLRRARSRSPQPTRTGMRMRSWRRERRQT
jgi:hypothetical protein